MEELKKHIINKLDRLSNEDLRLMYIVVNEFCKAKERKKDDDYGCDSVRN